MNSKTIFLTGLPRSGTTWASKMISFSPSVNYVSGEPFNPGTSKKLFGHKWPWYIAISGNEGSEFDEILKNVFNKQWQLHDFIRRYKFLLKHERRDLRPYFRIWKLYFSYLFQSGKITLLKDPTGFFSTEVLAEKLNTQIIILTRHPAAFVSSMQRVGWQFDFANLVKQPHLKPSLENYWDEVRYQAQPENSNSIIDKHILMWKIYHHLMLDWANKYKSWIFLSHEKLSSNPHQEFQTLYKRLNIEFTNKVERNILEYTKDSNEITAGSHIHLLKRDSRATSEIWKNDLSASVIDKILRETESMRAHFYAQPFLDQK